MSKEYCSFQAQTTLTVVQNGTFSIWVAIARHASHFAPSTGPCQKLCGHRTFSILLRAMGDVFLAWSDEECHAVLAGLYQEVLRDVGRWQAATAERGRHRNNDEISNEMNEASKGLRSHSTSQVLRAYTSTLMKLTGEKQQNPQQISNNNNSNIHSSCKCPLTRANNTAAFA